MNTQLVCETQPACECAGGDDPYSCDCKYCGEPTVVIDVDTGDVMRNGVVTTCH